MLVQFAFENFRSFKDQATLSLVAASKIQADPALDRGNVFLARERPKLELLRVGGLYGANAGGKSNVARALSVFRTWVLESANLGFRRQPSPFRLDTVSRDRPVFFEITFVQEEMRDAAPCRVQYRYGFEIKTGAEQPVVLSEWLYEAETTTEALLFEREGSSVRQGRRFTEGKALLKDKHLNRTDALFLSLLAQFGTPQASRLVHYFRDDIQVIAGINDERLHEFSLHCLEEDRHGDAIQSLMREADIGIPRLVTARRQAEKQTRVLAEHPVFDEEGTPVDFARFSLDFDESQGTQKLFAYAGPILDALEHGRALMVDEMDARFHPLLTRALIRLFQSPETNPKNAQIVFITHDTNLLDSKSLRRDQIMFVEKDRFGASHLYALSDFKGIRKGASFEDDYIQGRYGAIPFLGGLNRLFTDTAEDASKTKPETTHAEA